MKTRKQPQASPLPTKNKRMSITLPAEVAEMLEFLATSQSITQNEALRKTIATENYFRREIMQGATILITNSDKESVKEVVLR